MTKKEENLPNHPFIELRDIPYIFVLPLLAIIAWLTPQKFWKATTSRLVHLFFLGPKCLGRPLFLRCERATENLKVSKTPAEIAHAYVANKLLLQFEYFQELRGGKLDIQTELKGGSFLDEAVQGDQGVLLWVMPASSSDFLAKKVLAENGYAVSHLSDVTHGYSGSRFGVKYINGINRHVENKYLKDRIIMDRTAPGNVLKELQRRVKSGEIVSITAVENKGRKSEHVPLFGGQLPLGAGAIFTAFKTGCPLLPVFTHRVDDRHYVIEIEPTIPVNRELSRGEAINDALSAYGAVLRPHILRDPDQWYGWTHMQFESDQVKQANTIWDWINKAT